MKKNIIRITLLLVCICFFPQMGKADESITVGGRVRSYKLYVPAGISKPKGIIVALHGLGGTSNFFFNEYSITDLANRKEYIVLAPQALAEQDPSVAATISALGSTAGIDIPLNAVWGCGMQIKIPPPLLSNLELNAGIADEEFIREIIEKTLRDYDLPIKNIFMLGVSMGGFMTYQYAEKYPQQLAGIIAISGSRGFLIRGTSNVPLPVLDFHSDQDEIVPYSGSWQVNQLGITSVAMAYGKNEVINYWVNRNGANTTPKEENVNYYASLKNIKVTKYTYAQLSKGNEVIHYKMTSSTKGVPAHDYLFSSAKGDCMDYVVEVEKFITAHADKNGNGIINISATPANIVGYYSIWGIKLPKAPEKGIYIIKYDNGKSEKILK